MFATNDTKFETVELQSMSVEHERTLESDL